MKVDVRSGLPPRPRLELTLGPSCMDLFPHREKGKMAAGQVSLHNLYYQQ